MYPGLRPGLSSAVPSGLSRSFSAVRVNLLSRFETHFLRLLQSVIPREAFSSSTGLAAQGASREDSRSYGVVGDDGLLATAAVCSVRRR